eukprot:9801306-Alexandrium_andersonii.AAC.1
MSASLVGSEMCIRDRKFARPDCLAQDRPDVPFAAQHGQADEGRNDEADAVSYTHLTLPTICSV